VFSGNLGEDAWTDLELSSVVGQKTSLVLIKVTLLGAIASNPTTVFLKPLIKLFLQNWKEYRTSILNFYFSLDTLSSKIKNNLF